jgi:CheY-like chemotaxis protein
MNWRPQGLLATITVPSAGLGEAGSTAEERDDSMVPEIDIPGIGRPRAGMRVLVVEDEPLIAMQIESALGRQSFAVVGPVSRLSHALQVVRTEPLDGAIVDANLAGESSGSLVTMLREREIPFIVVTGYAERGLPPDFNGAPVVSKPFDEETITRLLAQRLADVKAAL